MRSEFPVVVVVAVAVLDEEQEAFALRKRKFSEGNHVPVLCLSSVEPMDQQGEEKGASSLQERDSRTTFEPHAASAAENGSPTREGEENQRQADETQ